MQRAMLAFLAVGCLLAVGSLLGLPVQGQEPPRLVLDALSGADRVTLYQNGLAFVELDRTFAAPGGEALLVLSLPSTARFDSLRLEGDGIEVVEVRSALSASGPLQPGDRVVLRTTSEQRYEGTYLGDESGSFALVTEGGVALVQPQHVEAIEILGAAANVTGQPTPGAVEAVFRVQATGGARSVHVSYLAMGSGWTPTYDLDLDAGRLAFRAMLTALHDWSDVTLDLVSGAPNVVLTPVPGAPIPYAAKLEDEATSTMARAAGGMDVAMPSVPLGDLHRYRVEGPVDLRRGETVRLLVEEGPAPVERSYYEAQADVGYVGFAGASGAETPVPVTERVTIRNGLGEPLPPGVALAYRNGTWVGEDMLAATSENKTANLTLSSAQDVKARLVLESFVGGETEDVGTYALYVENGKTGPVDVRATLTYPPHRTALRDVEPEPDERRGTTLTWNREVAANGTLRVAATVVSAHEPIPMPAEAERSVEMPVEDGAIARPVATPTAPTGGPGAGA